MKKMLLMLIIISSLFISCEKETKFKLDPNSTIAITYAAEATRSDVHFSAKEIVLQAGSIRFYDTSYEAISTRGFSESQKDTINNRLLMLSTDILDPIGDSIRILPNFIEGRNVVIIRLNENLSTRDTIAYVPAAVHRKAEKDIYAAFEVGDYEKCMQLFEKAFTFVPITGAEWRALPENNVN